MIRSIRNLGYSQSQLEEFLRESNAIERKYDDDCLMQSKIAWEWLYVEGEREMSLAVIKHIHGLLMKNPSSWDDTYLHPKWAGEFRNGDVYIGGNTALYAKYIIKELENWCAEMNKPRDLQPDMLETLSKRLHVEYERIHPFFDGNGRTGRIFMNYWRLKQGLPLLVIHTGEEQWEYYKWFRKNI